MRVYPVCCHLYLCIVLFLLWATWLFIERFNNIIITTTAAASAAVVARGGRHSTDSSKLKGFAATNRQHLVEFPVL
jgi:hypothetical protein